MPRETRVWEILLATKPDLPTPEKKMVPEDWRRVRVKARVWERSRCWKKKLRWLCWDLNRFRRVVSSIEHCVVVVVVLGLEDECGMRRSKDDGGRDPMIFFPAPQDLYREMLVSVALKSESINHFAPFFFLY